MWSRNTVGESQHISFFCNGNPFCEVVRRQNTDQGEDMLPWVTRKSLPSVQNYRTYVVFSSPMREYETASSPTYFLFMTGYRNLHNSAFFPGNFFILSANEISITLSIGNKLYSSHHLFIFLFPVKPLCGCYLATSLKPLSLSPVLCR